MTGPENYLRAQDLAAQAAAAGNGSTTVALAAVGQIHATLALAAASALAAVTPLRPRDSWPAEAQAWRDAAGVPD